MDTNYTNPDWEASFYDQADTGGCVPGPTKKFQNNVDGFLMTT
jgi:hypothetical protein